MQRFITGKKISIIKDKKIFFIFIKITSMISISKSVLDKRVVPTISKNTADKNTQSLLEKYMAYAERQGDEMILWYMKVIMFIPCVAMVLSVIAMAMLTPNYVWFVGLSMILFFANVVVHISQVKSTVFVPLYHITVAVLTIIPIITYLIIT